MALGMPALVIAFWNSRPLNDTKMGDLVPPLTNCPHGHANTRHCTGSQCTYATVILHEYIKSAT